MHAIARFLIMCLAFGIGSPPAFAFHAGLADVRGECVFSEEFKRDYGASQKQVDELQSAEPLLLLQEKYREPEEQAELALSIGLAYGQRTGVVDPAKAVVYLSNALEFSLPERTRLEIFMWRGNSLEQLKNYDQALRDYLRGLLACSYYDLSGGWPEIKPSKLAINMRSDDPENAQRLRDYQRYRKTMDFQEFLLMQRYYWIEAVKRLQTAAGFDEAGILKVLKELSPDTSRYDPVIGWIRSENKQPWP